MGSNPDDARRLAPEGLASDPEETYNPVRSAAGHSSAWITDSFPSTPSTPAVEYHRTRAKSRTGGSREVGGSSSEVFIAEPVPYHFLRKAGEGGFGEVWEAVQLSLGRTVAVKKVRDDLLDAAENDVGQSRYLERLFRLEALTTANLDHPNILPIHDLGMDERGHPLLAMKFIQGTPWHAMIREDFPELAPVEFLAKHVAILMDVCQAIAFAHARGLLHRDLKPSQVMVGDFGEVLVMDWGLAMTYSPDMLRDSIPHLPIETFPDCLTAICPAGTPAFMAPEQTERTGTRLGPWTDIYLLGATLYYMLTGCLVHEGTTPQQVFYHASTGQVVPPQERKPDREIPDDLAELAMRALRPEPRDRIQSAKEFLQGLSDYQSGASRRRQSLAETDLVEERLQEYELSYDDFNELQTTLASARGNWPGNPAFGALRTRLLARYAAAALKNDDLLLARVQAERLGDGPERRALLAEILAGTEQKRLAEARLLKAHEQLNSQHARAEELINFLLGELRQKLEPIGRLDVLDAVGEKVLSYYNKMDPEELNQSSLLRKCEALRRVGEVCLGKGDLSEAVGAFTDALAISMDLTEQDPGDDAVLLNQAMGHGSLGSALRARGELAEALRHFEAQRKLLRHLVKRAPEDLDLKISLADNHYSIADARAVQGDLDGASKHNRALRELMEKIVAEVPHRDDLNAKLAGAYADHGWLRRNRGDFDGAYRRYMKAIEIMSGIVMRNTDNLTHRANIAFFHNKIGWVLEGKEDFKGAIRHYHSSIEIMSELSALDPSNAEWRRLVSISSTRAGYALVHAEDFEGAMDQFERGIGELQPLMERAPRNVWNRQWLAKALCGLGVVQARMGRPTQAEESWERALEATSEIVQDVSAAELGHIATHAEALVHLGRREEARPYIIHLARKDYKADAFLTMCRQEGLYESKDLNEA